MVWLYENVNTRIEGQIVGFDEYMNLVLDQATEVHTKRGTEKQLGRIMLKVTISLVQAFRRILKQLIVWDNIGQGTYQNRMCHKDKDVLFS